MRIGIRQDYENIKKQTNEPNWYKELGVLEKKLILQNIDSILDGKTISSQLKHLPGLKNAYVEIRGNTEEIEGKTTLKETYAEFRTGAIAQYGNKSDRDNLTKRNVKHLSDLAGGPLKLNVLNSNNALGFFRVGEAPICNLTENSAKDFRDVSYNNIPLSAQLTTPRLLLGLVISTATLPLTLMGGLGYAALRGDSKQIMNFITAPIKFVLQSGKDSRLDSLSSLSEEAAKSQKSPDSKQPLYMCYMCKSGKDRTGMQTLINNIQNTFTTLGSESAGQKKAVAAAIVDTGHSEAISGSHGATIGITELKSNGVFSGISAHFIGAFKGELEGGALSKQNHLRI